MSRIFLLIAYSFLTLGTMQHPRDECTSSRRTPERFVPQDAMENRAVLAEKEELACPWLGKEEL